MPSVQVCRCNLVFLVVVTSVLGSSACGDIPQEAKNPPDSSGYHALISTSPRGPRFGIEQAGAIGSPYETKFGSDDWFNCSGTLIAPDVVLTAAHCLPAKHERQQKYSEGQMYFYWKTSPVDKSQYFNKTRVHQFSVHPHYHPLKHHVLTPLELTDGKLEEMKHKVIEKCGDFSDQTSVSKFSWMVGMPDEAMLAKEQKYWSCVRNIKEIDGIAVDFQIAPSRYNDIALLFLETPIVDITPAHLSDGAIEVESTDEITAAGYGLQDRKGAPPREYSREQRAGAIQILKWGSHEITLDDSQSLLCYGDSGGPIYRFQGGAVTVVGISSRVDTTPLSKQCTGVSVATRVSPYISWIDKAITAWNARQP